ncbi:MAG TPA: regulatory protein GemA [Sphingobium sp.]
MSAAARRAVPAQFDASAQRRRSLLAKVHLARKQLGMDEDTYRGAMHEATGHMSAGDCSEVELAKALKHFEARGFAPKPRTKGGRRPATHKLAGKARALLISLYHLNAVDSASEQALEAWAARQLKVVALQWADQTQCDKLIEALKAVAERNGWSQKLIGHYAKMDSAGKVHVLKYRLCEAILVKLKDKGVAPADWSLDIAAWRLCGLDFGPAKTGEDLELCARSLGRKLREAGQ